MAELQKSKTAVPANVMCADSLEAFRMFDGLPAVPEWLQVKNRSSSQKNTELRDSKTEWQEEQSTPRSKQTVSDEGEPRKKNKMSRIDSSMTRRQLFVSRENGINISTEDDSSHQSTVSRGDNSTSSIAHLSGGEGKQPAGTFNDDQDGCENGR